MGEIDIAPNKALKPVCSDLEPMAKDRYGTNVIGASKEDDGPDRMGTKIEGSVEGEGCSGGSMFDTEGSSSTNCNDPSIGLLLHIDQRLVVKSRPYLSLPSAIKALDRILEPMFSWRSKHRCHSQEQTKPDDLAHHIGILMGTLKNVVVIELGVGRKAELPPTAGEQFHGHR